MDIKGKIKETTGAATGNDRLKHEGQAEQAVDKIKDAAGTVADKVKDALKGDRK